MTWVLRTISFKCMLKLQKIKFDKKLEVFLSIKYLLSSFSFDSRLSEPFNLYLSHEFLSRTRPRLLLLLLLLLWLTIVIIVVITHYLFLFSLWLFNSEHKAQQLLSFSFALGTAGWQTAWHREWGIVALCEFADVAHIRSGMWQAKVSHMNLHLYLYFITSV